MRTETTKLSSKGQIVLPKAIREARKWKAGTEFTVEDRPEGILIRPKRLFPPTTPEQVFGCLKYDGPPVSVEQMEQGIVKEVRRRYARGRY